MQYFYLVGCVLWCSGEFPPGICTALGVYMQSGSVWAKASDLLSVHEWELWFCGRDAPWLEETIQYMEKLAVALTVAVGAMFSVRSHGGFVTHKPP